MAIIRDCRSNSVPHLADILLDALVEFLDRYRRAVILQATPHLLDRGPRERGLGAPQDDDVTAILNLQLSAHARPCRSRTGLGMIS